MTTDPFGGRAVPTVVPPMKAFGKQDGSAPAGQGAVPGMAPAQPRTPTETPSRAAGGPQAAPVTFTPGAPAAAPTVPARPMKPHSEQLPPPVRGTLQGEAIVHGQRKILANGGRG